MVNNLVVNILRKKINFLIKDTSYKTWVGLNACKTNLELIVFKFDTSYLPLLRKTLVSFKTEDTMLCIQIARDKTIENKIDKAVTILNSPAFNPNLELFVYNNDSGVWFKILPNKEKIETSFCKFLNLDLCSLLSTPE